MPGLTGLESLARGKAAIPGRGLHPATAFGTVEEAVKAMKDGAIDSSPPPSGAAVKVVRQALSAAR